MPLTDQCPRHELSDDQEVRVASFNSLPENLRSFRVLVTTPNLQKYKFFSRGASLPGNSHRLDSALDERTCSSSSEF